MQTVLLFCGKVFALRFSRFCRSLSGPFVFREADAAQPLWTHPVTQPFASMCVSGVT